MKLDKLVAGLNEAKASFGLDGTDLTILDEVVRAKKSKGEVTIMEMIHESSAASPATVHERIKRLCNNGFLRKDPHPGNLRLKVLDTHDEYDKLVKRLGAI
jgi:DNA-binding MarR family transcriptional regulator